MRRPTRLIPQGSNLLNPSASLALFRCLLVLVLLLPLRPGIGGNAALVLPPAVSCVIPQARRQGASRLQRYCCFGITAAAHPPCHQQATAQRGLAQGARTCIRVRILRAFGVTRRRRPSLNPSRRRANGSTSPRRVASRACRRRRHNSHVRRRCASGGASCAAQTSRWQKCRLAALVPALPSRPRGPPWPRRMVTRVRMLRLGRSPSRGRPQPRQRERYEANSARRHRAC